MALSIKHPEADRLARELAHETGESLTDAIITALRERLERQRARGVRRRLTADVARVQARYRRARAADRRSAEEIVGYDEHGLPR